MLHNTHGVIEHDGSLSRRDAVFDPSNRFDEGTFNNLVSYFGNSTAIDIPTMANTRARHALDMSLINPGFNITETAVPVILGENAMMMAIWGHPERPIANRAFYEYFFRKLWLQYIQSFVAAHTSQETNVSQWSLAGSQVTLRST